MADLFGRKDKLAVGHVSDGLAVRLVVGINRQLAVDGHLVSAGVVEEDYPTAEPAHGYLPCRVQDRVGPNDHDTARLLGLRFAAEPGEPLAEIETLVRARAAADGDCEQAEAQPADQDSVAVMSWHWSFC